MAKSILIVDDDRIFIKTLEKNLADQGYEFFIANDGLEGLAILQKGGIDLILLDIEMPTMNGYSFLFEMRKIKSVASTPVIVLTCKEKMEDIFRVEGVCEYIVKPLSHVELLEKIKKHL